MLSRLWIVCGFCLFLLVSVRPAHAAVEFCNQLTSPLEVAFAYPKTASQWASKGWYVLTAGECQIIHAGDDPGMQGDKATYYYYAVSFMGKNQLTWAGADSMPDARTFCMKNEAFDLDRNDTPCEQQGLVGRSYLPMEVTVSPGQKHVLQFRNAGSSAPPAADSKGTPGQ
ncbi:MAG: DUF1036 domain-containing protein [Pseudomonadota bacterium]|nr:DUF1036 domain-containing protein [Pseudomonadota bacterium]